MKLLAVLILVLTTIACGSGFGFEVSSTNPSSGQAVTISGTANPGQVVEFQTSFQMDLPVISGGYAYEASSVEIPQKPNKFGVTVEGVKDLNVGIKLGIWITKGFKAKNGRVSLSQSNVPPGRYDLKIFGEALENQSSVLATIKAETAVKADSDGKYKLVVDTSGIPAGAYTIEGLGEIKTIQVGGMQEELTSTSKAPGFQGLSPSAQIAPQSSSQSRETPEVIAFQNGTEKSGINENRNATARSEEKPVSEPSLLGQIKAILGF